MRAAFARKDLAALVREAEASQASAVVQSRGLFALTGLCRENLAAGVAAAVAAGGPEFALRAAEQYGLSTLLQTRAWSFLGLVLSVAPDLAPRMVAAGALGLVVACLRAHQTAADCVTAAAVALAALTTSVEHAARAVKLGAIEVHKSGSKRTGTLTRAAALPRQWWTPRAFTQTTRRCSSSRARRCLTCARRVPSAESPAGRDVATSGRVLRFCRASRRSLLPGVVVRPHAGRPPAAVGPALACGQRAARRLRLLRGRAAARARRRRCARRGGRRAQRRPRR